MRLFISAVFCLFFSLTYSINAHSAAAHLKLLPSLDDRVRRPGSSREDQNAGEGEHSSRATGSSALVSLKKMIRKNSGAMKLPL